MMQASMDLSGINAKLDRLARSAKDAARPAAQAGAQIFHDEVRARVPMSAKPHKSGKAWYTPGTLRKAIYQAYAEKDSGNGKATYRIAWNRSHAFYGKFLEWGTVKMAPKPFLRPAYDAARDRAIRAAQQMLAASVKKS